MFLKKFLSIFSGDKTPAGSDLVRVPVQQRVVSTVRSNRAPRRLSDQDKNDVMKLLQQGWSKTKISKELGIHHASVERILKKLKGPQKGGLTLVVPPPILEDKKSHQKVSRDFIIPDGFTEVDLNAKEYLSWTQAVLTKRDYTHPHTKELYFSRYSRAFRHGFRKYYVLRTPARIVGFYEINDSLSFGSERMTYATVSEWPPVDQNPLPSKEQSLTALGAALHSVLDKKTNEEILKKMGWQAALDAFGGAFPEIGVEITLPDGDEKNVG